MHLLKISTLQTWLDWRFRKPYSYDGKTRPMRSNGSSYQYDHWMWFVRTISIGMKKVTCPSFGFVGSLLFYLLTNIWLFMLYNMIFSIHNSRKMTQYLGFMLRLDISYLLATGTRLDIYGYINVNIIETK